MEPRYSVTANCSVGSVDNIEVEKKVNGKVFWCRIERDEISQAAIEYAENFNLFKNE